MINSIIYFFKWLYSFISKKPVNLGYRLMDEPVYIEEEPIQHKAKNLVFFGLRKDLGPFEITRVFRGKKKEVRYRVHYSHDDRTFDVPKNLFDFLFEEIPPVDIDWKTTQPPEQKDPS